MSCSCRDEQILELNGRRVVLKGLQESFRYVRLIRGHNDVTNLGLVLVKALRDVGNDIPAEEEAQYARILTEMFDVFCAVDVAVDRR